MNNNANSINKYQSSPNRINRHVLPYYKSQAKFQSPQYDKNLKYFQTNRNSHLFYKSSFNTNDHKQRQQSPLNSGYQANQHLTLRSYYSQKNRQDQSMQINFLQKSQFHDQAIGYGHLLKKNSKNKTPLKIQQNKDYITKAIQKNNSNTHKRNYQLNGPRSPRLNDERSKKFISQIRQQIRLNSPRNNQYTPKSPIKIEQYSKVSSQNMTQSEVNVAIIRQDCNVQYDQHDQENQQTCRGKLNSKHYKNKNTCQMFELTYQTKQLQNQIQLRTYQVQKMTKKLFAEQSKHQSEINSLINEHRLTLNRKEHQKQILIKELQHYKKHIQNLEKNKLQKEKFFIQEINKYNLKLIESESLRSSSGLQYQQRLKQNIQKKQKFYKEILQQKQSKYKTSLTEYKKIIQKKQEQNIILKELYQTVIQNSKNLEQKIIQLGEQISIIQGQRTISQEKQNQFLKLALHQSNFLRVQFDRVTKQRNQLQLKSYSNQTFLKRLSNQNESLKQEIKQLGEEYQAVKFKYERKEIQLNQINQDRYEQHSKLKESIYENQEFIEQMKIKTNNLSKQVQRLKTINLMLQEKLSEEKQSSQNNLILYQKCSFQCQKKNQEILKISQQNIYLQNQKLNIFQNLQELQYEYKEFKIKIEHEIAHTSFQKNLSNTQSMYSQNSTTDWVQRIEGLQSQIGQLMQNFKKQKSCLLKSHQKENEQMKDKILSVQKLLLKKEQQLLQVKNKLQKSQTSRKKASQQFEDYIIKSKQEIKKLNDLRQINQNFKISIKSKFDQQRQKNQQALISNEKQLESFKKSSTKILLQLKQNFYQLIQKLVVNLNSQIKLIALQLEKIETYTKNSQKEQFRTSNLCQRSSQKVQQKRVRIFAEGDKLNFFSYFEQQLKVTFDIYNKPNQRQNIAMQDDDAQKENKQKLMNAMLKQLQCIIIQVKIRSQDLYNFKQVKYLDQTGSNIQISRQLQQLRIINQNQKLLKKEQQEQNKRLLQRNNKLIEEFSLLKKDFKVNQQNIEQKQNNIRLLQKKLQDNRQQHQEHQRKIEKLQKQIKKLKAQVEVLQKHLLQKQLKIKENQNKKNSQNYHSNIQLEARNLHNFQSQITQTNIQEIALGYKQKTPKKIYKNKNGQQTFKENTHFASQQQNRDKNKDQNKIMYYQQELIPQYESRIKTLQQNILQKDQMVKLLQQQLKRIIKECQLKEVKFNQESHSKLIGLQAILKNYESQNQKLFAQNKQLYLNTQNVQNLEDQFTEQAYLSKKYKEDLIKKQTIIRELQNQISLQSIRYKAENEHLKASHEQFRIKLNVLQNYNVQLLSSISQNRSNDHQKFDSQIQVQMQTKKRNSSLVIMAQQNKQKIQFEQLEARVEIYEKMLKDKQVDLENYRHKYDEANKQKVQILRQVQQHKEQLSLQFRQMQKMALQIEQLKFINMSKCLNYEPKDSRQRQNKLFNIISYNGKLGEYRQKQENQISFCSFN